MALTDITIFGTDDKIAIALKRFRTFEPPEGFYLAFSGGKDSIVIKELAIMSGVLFDAHYNVTTIDPPELVRFIRRYHPDVIWDRPAKPFLIRLVEKGFPVRTRRWCCKEYKEKGGIGRLVVTGVRAKESPARAKRGMVENCYTGLKRYFHPIIDWSEDEVWEFIRLRNLPYCCLYDEGFKRIGCILCPMNYGRLREAQNWPGYIEQFRRAFVKRYDVMFQVSTHYARWKSGEEMFNWWLNKKPAKMDDPRQGRVFD